MDEATISDIKRESSNPYWSLVTPADLDTLLDIEKAYFNILKSFSPEQQLKHTLVINFNILLKKKEQIAKELYRSPNTIKTHKKRLFEKLKVSTIAEAVMLMENYNLN